MCFPAFIFPSLKLQLVSGHLIPRLKTEKVKPFTPRILVHIREITSLSLNLLQHEWKTGFCKWEEEWNVCADQRERKRWHIRPEGASLLECLASTPPFTGPSLSQSQDHWKDKTELRPPYSSSSSSSSFCTGHRSSCSLITPWYNAVLLCKYSHINPLHSPLKIRRVRSFTSPASQCNTAAKCARSPRLNGNLVGINST